MEENIENKNLTKKYKIKETIKTISIVLLLLIVFSYASTDSEQQNIELKQQIENISSENANLIANNKNLQNQISKTEDSQSNANINTEKDNQIAVLQKSIEDLHSDLENFENDKKQFEEQIKTLETENANLTTEISSLKSELNAKSSETTGTPTAQSSYTHENYAHSNENCYTVYITDTGSKYHSSNCSYLKKSKHEIDKNSAISQGYTACSKCHP